MDNKQNRAFIGLPLNRKQMLSHVQLCQFRSGLTFAQLVNLTVYILYHLRDNGIFDDGLVYCVDSSELPVDRQQLLATLTVKGKKIRIYAESVLFFPLVTPSTAESNRIITLPCWKPWKSMADRLHEIATFSY